MSARDLSRMNLIGKLGFAEHEIKREANLRFLGNIIDDLDVQIGRVNQLIGMNPERNAFPAMLISLQQARTQALAERAAIVHSQFSAQN